MVSQQKLMNARLPRGPRIVANGFRVATALEGVFLPPRREGREEYGKRKEILTTDGRGFTRIKAERQNFLSVFIRVIRG
jgi:hypothetical protein